MNILLVIGACLSLASCNPFEREIVEEIVHEAGVAEQAVVHDVESQVSTNG